MPLTPQDIADCIRVLEELVEDRGELASVDPDTCTRLLIAAGRVSRPGRLEQRLLSRAVRKQKAHVKRQANEAKLERTGIRRQRLLPVFITPDPATRLEAETGGAAPTPADWDSPTLSEARVCYVCKTERDRLHFFYDQLCEACGDFNYAKRSQTADLKGRVALISGARVKIGYQAAMMLLRAGARVIVSTRFPRDAAQRYAREVDFADFRDRLQIYGLDLRHTPSVEAFARHLLQTEQRLDFLLHNACQTVRRPSGFYQHLMQGELGPVSTLPAAAQSLVEEYEAMRMGSSKPRLSAQHGPAALAIGLHAAPALSQVALTTEDLETGPQLFPTGVLDADLQQVDLRTVNSWRLALDQVGTVELLEVQLVNAIAPFVLNARLKPLMLRDAARDKHIVNVSAMEGQFYRRFKTDKHPHTNMAKAALNMMTRTSAPDYARDGIHMNSVDTGWITDEDPAHVSERKTAESGFQPPLDIVDGAARIVDPIFHGINTGRHVWGQFLKDYKPTAW
jgi:NAD(P)-dependent dehydrogenase (short-subunit alcohol dehydrogenase family)